ncbi:MAG: UDP-N-acetylmuramoyl-L-alanyl-D-glutamate--2,6-diaminopimelate ligase [Bacillota bacterium]
MHLSELIKNIGVLKVEGNDRVDIKGIAYDSRAVEPGFLFVAIEGFKTDGHNYAARAVEAGAPAVVVQKEVDLPAGVTRVLVENTRVALARASAAFYGHPSQKMRVVGVTGTNGKTTTTYLISSIYRAAGEKVGLIGTIANYIGDRKLDVSHTTPESADLQKLLREMADEGVTVAVIEVSSHALSLERVTGCQFDVGVFTNLTQDHLDFHRDMEDYLGAKARLFRGIDPGAEKWPRYVVVNRDDPYADRIIQGSRVPVVTYGLSPGADVRALDIKITGQGNSFTVAGRHGSVKLSMKLTGLFNVYNSLAAFAVGVTAGFNPDLVAKALETAGGVSGRFELVDCGQDFTVVVDYAHTPDGLENILKAARSVTSGRLINVFGCGGDRDRTKRPIMGEIAGRYSDLPIITSDNPRTEDPLRIIEDVEEGIKRVLKPGQYRVMPDRREAIRAAITEAKSGDMVLIAGKGHEDYQIIGRQKFHFDDREEARKVLQSLSNK